jgi:outer membrane lipoprotein
LFYVYAGSLATLEVSDTWSKLDNGHHLGKNLIMRMRKTSMSLPVIAVSLALISCAPVLSKTLMEQGTGDVSFNALRENPDAYKGKLFILGGVIVDTKNTAKGSQIEALYLPVDSYGHLKNVEQSQGRYLAILPPEKGILDSIMYRAGREITPAGEFTGPRKGKIDEMEYVFPVFEIEQAYLWVERPYYLAPYDTYYLYPEGWH